MDPEQQWIEAARHGNQWAFEQLVNAYQRPVYNLVHRMLGDPVEAEDAAQETFLRAYHRLESYQPERKFSTWILSIAAHHAIDVLRRRHFRWIPLDELPPWRWFPIQTDEPEAAVVKSETQDQVQRLLASLPPGYRLVTILRYWYDMSYEEIAQATGLSESALKSRLHRARLKLAEGLQPESLETVQGSGSPGSHGNGEGKTSHQTADGDKRARDKLAMYVFQRGGY